MPSAICHLGSIVLNRLDSCTAAPWVWLSALLGAMLLLALSFLYVLADALSFGCLHELVIVWVVS